MTGVAFALFDWIDRRQGPLEQLYEERPISLWYRSLRLFAEQVMPAFQP